MWCDVMWCELIVSDKPNCRPNSTTSFWFSVQWFWSYTRGGCNIIHFFLTALTKWSIFSGVKQQVNNCVKNWLWLLILWQLWAVAAGNMKCGMKIMNTYTSRLWMSWWCVHVTSKQIWHVQNIYLSNVKGKAVLLQAWSGPEGSRKLRFPDFLTTAQDGSNLSNVVF
jgi:hypothetical protein